MKEYKKKKNSQIIYDYNCTDEYENSENDFPFLLWIDDFYEHHKNIKIILLINLCLPPYLRNKIENMIPLTIIDIKKINDLNLFLKNLLKNTLKNGKFNILNDIGEYNLKIEINHSKLNFIIKEKDLINFFNNQKIAFNMCHSLDFIEVNSY
jgi:hypothetical protein